MAMAASTWSIRLPLVSWNVPRRSCLAAMPRRFSPCERTTVTMPLHAHGPPGSIAPTRHCSARGRGGEGDRCARVGGDDVAVLLSDVADIAPAESVAQKIVVMVSEPFACGGVQLAVGASVGVALYPTDGRSAEALIQAADRAMYLAKRHDTKKFFSASAELGDAAGERARLVS